MKIYFAGPEVFRPDARVWAEEVRRLARQAGHQALIPLDSEADTAAAIYASNIAMIEQADALIASLDAFRGAEPDSGTAFEVGYALARGKPVVGVMRSAETVAERVGRWQRAALDQREGWLVDTEGFHVENFGLPLNLMLAVPLVALVRDIPAALAAVSAPGESASQPH